MFLSTLAASDFLHTGFKRVRVLFSMMQKWVMSFRIVPWTPSFACSTGGKSSGELPQVAPLLYREAFIVAWQNSPGCHSPNLDKNTQLRLVLSFLLFLIPQFSPRKGSSYVFNSLWCTSFFSFVRRDLFRLQTVAPRACSFSCVPHGTVSFKQGVESARGVLVNKDAFSKFGEIIINRDKCLRIAGMLMKLCRNRYAKTTDSCMYLMMPWISVLPITKWKSGVLVSLLCIALFFFSLPFSSSYYHEILLNPVLQKSVFFLLGSCKVFGSLLSWKSSV